MILTMPTGQHGCDECGNGLDAQALEVKFDEGVTVRLCGHCRRELVDKMAAEETRR
ncbi:MAG TPA: hypothetical protein VF981_13625 [Gemmatimonadaceae bacterium]